MGNVSSKPVVCKRCSCEAPRASNRQQFCQSCQRVIANEKSSEHYKKTYIKKGYNQSGENNNNWVSGIGIYRGLLSHIKQCSTCNSEDNLLVHHLDSNRSNNNPSNLIKLCKRCHQNEHRCWESLPRGNELSDLKSAQAKSAKRDINGKFVKSHKV